MQSVSVGTPNPCAIDATRLVGTAHPAAICLATVSSARATASRDRILPPVGAAQTLPRSKFGNSSGGRTRGLNHDAARHNLPPLTDGANLPFTRALSRASCCDLILRRILSAGGGGGGDGLTEAEAEEAAAKEERVGWGVSFVCVF